MPASLKVLLLLLLLLVFGSASQIRAQDSTVEPSPFRPESNGRDWVKMSSGEWLMGDVKSLRDDDLLFDSEDLDELDIDWDDVAELYSPRILTYVFEDKIVIAGKAQIRGNEIVISDGIADHRMTRVDLLGIIEGEPKEINYWSAKLGLGFVGRSGNTDQADLNSVLRIKREAALTRLSLNYETNHGTLNGEDSINNQRATATLDFFVYRDLFISVPTFEYYSDHFQNTDYRWSLGASLGYFVIRDSKVEWSFSLGTSYQQTQYLSVEEGSDIGQDTGTLNPSTSFDWDLTGALEFEFNYNAKVGIPDTKNTFHHALALLSVEIWNDDLKLETSLTWDRTESPHADEYGVVPQRDDFRSYVGFSLDL